MESINLGKADGLPVVDWAAITDTIAAGTPPEPDGVNSRTTWLATVNDDGSPHVTASRRDLAGRNVLVPDRHRHAEVTQHRA